jgi:uncharacterized protein
VTPGDGAARHVAVERNILVPLPDGVELAADLYLPSGSGRHPVLVSYYPYHKDDVIGAAYEYANRYFAENGYATLLVDFRGLGGSSGVARPAMDHSEGADGAAIVEWAARRPWCDGNVGMWGLSYGGITSLATAAMRPPSLKAIAPMMATDDIYHHWFYPGGCPNLMGVYGVWGPMMLAFQLMPPMFHDHGGRWEDVWEHRLEHARPYLLDWPEHRHFDDYWRARVIDSSAITVPTFLIGGWRDIFPEAMVDVYRKIGADRQLLMGPWLHTQPDQSPFDAVEHLPAMLQWWDRWLRGTAAAPPSPAVIFVQGSGWHGADHWPPPGTVTTTWYPAATGELQAGEPAPPGAMRYEGHPAVGTAATLFDPLGLGIGLPLDQAADDAASATFTTAPLVDSITITGSAEAVLDVSIEQGEEVHLVAKLCDVGPDGRSGLITTGWLRMTEAGEHRVRLWATAYRVPAGHRLRLSVACSDFPRIWPTAVTPTIAIRCGGAEGSRLVVPTIDPQALESASVPAPAAHVARAPLNLDFEPRWRIVRDPARRTVAVETGVRSVVATPSGDGRVELDHLGVATLDPARPGDTAVVARTTVRTQTPSGASVDVSAHARATRRSLTLSGLVTVDGGERFRRVWRRIGD